MIVICPKCKIKLKADETKLSEEGSRFKCPKCGTVLIVKKPAAEIKKTIDKNKILVAHANPSVLAQVASLLTGHNYQVITSVDGIEAMVKSLKELPFLLIIDVVLPKIYGFEVCKRLKSRPETKDMKFILITSVYNKTKYRREPDSLYGADEYIDEHSLATRLIEKINKLFAPPEEEKTETSDQPDSEITEPRQPDSPVESPEQVGRPGITEQTEPPIEPSIAEKIEKAKRLSRTIMSDIYLYNSAKVDEAIKNDNFDTLFAAEIKEGAKLYKNRISSEVRDLGDFFTEAMENFISEKRKNLADSLEN